MLLGKIAFYDQYVKSGAYSAQDRFSNFDQTFHDLEGMTWGIIGMGTIGRKVASLADAFWLQGSILFRLRQQHLHRLPKGRAGYAALHF